MQEECLTKVQSRVNCTLEASGKKKALVSNIHKPVEPFLFSICSGEFQDSGSYSFK